MLFANICHYLKRAWSLLTFQYVHAQKIETQKFLIRKTGNFKHRNHGKLKKASVLVPQILSYRKLAMLLEDNNELLLKGSIKG